MHPEHVKIIGQALNLMKPHETYIKEPLFLVFNSDQARLNETIKTALGFIQETGFGKKDCGPVEIVLAEVLNNVIEHAYVGKSTGIIELTIEPNDGYADFRIEDEGLAMPTGEVPKGLHQNLAVDIMDLPEGGFGWLLIHELTQGLDYVRKDPRNILTFSMTPQDAKQ